MGSILKYIVPVFLAILLGLFVFSILKSCQNKAQQSTVTSTVDDKGVTDDSEEDELADLFEEEDDEGGTDDGTGSTTDPEDAANKEEAEAEDPKETEEPEAPRKDPTVQSGGDFLVLAGTFISQQNAKAEVSRLQKLGFDKAEVVEFDFSEYHTVCVDRHMTEREANAIKRNLINKHQIEAYVHKKRPPSKRGS